MVRKPAEWMNSADDRILEFIRDEGNLTPAAISNLGGPSKSYVRTRCVELTKYGMLERIDRGLYRITDDGIAYLEGDLDASELEPVDDS